MAGLAAHKRLFAQPRRVYHNGLVKRPGRRASSSFGATVKSGGDVVATDLASDLLAVPAAQMNAAVQGVARRRSRHGRRPTRSSSGGSPRATPRRSRSSTTKRSGSKCSGRSRSRPAATDGLPFLRAPKDGVPLAHLDFQPGALQRVAHDQRTLGRAAADVRQRPDAVRGRPQQRVRGAARRRPRRRTIDLRSEILKVPHHGSHEFTPEFLDAVSPLVSVVSSGDENARKEYIAPRARR